MYVKPFCLPLYFKSMTYCLILRKVHWLYDYYCRICKIVALRTHVHTSVVDAIATGCSRFIGLLSGLVIVTDTFFTVDDGGRGADVGSGSSHLILVTTIVCRCRPETTIIVTVILRRFLGAAQLRFVTRAAIDDVTVCREITEADVTVVRSHATADVTTLDDVTVVRSPVTAGVTALDDATVVRSPVTAGVTTLDDVTVVRSPVTAGVIAVDDVTVVRSPVTAGVTALDYVTVVRSHVTADVTALGDIIVGRSHAAAARCHSMTNLVCSGSAARLHSGAIAVLRRWVVSAAGPPPRPRPRPSPRPPPRPLRRPAATRLATRRSVFNTTPPRSGWRLTAPEDTASTRTHRGEVGLKDPCTTEPS